MNKKFFISFAIVLCAIFSFTVCFANTDGIGNDLGQARNDIRNFVGGVEDTVENAAKDVSNTSKDVTGVENGMKDNNDGFMGSMDDNNGRYSATRTSTDNTVLGMSSTAWTWLIVGIAAIAIIAVIWYYSMQFTNTNTHHDE